MPELLHRFKARGAGLEVFKRKETRVLLAGPAGTGKSRAAMEKLHQLMLRNPSAQGLIVRKTATSLTSTALKTWERDVVCDAMRDGSISFFGGSARKPPAYQYDNGSEVAIGGMDKPMKIMSSEYDVVYAQEATELTVDDVEAIVTRLRNGRISFQQLLMDCNPAHPTHFLKQGADSGQLVMLHSRHEDNPRYFDDNRVVTAEGAAYLEKLDSLTGVRKLRLRDGLWAAAEGVIYEEWDDAIHLVNRFDVPPTWERYWTVDFGYVHPFVWQDWAISKDGQAILVREIFMTGRIVEDHVEKIKQLVIDKRTGRWLCPRPRAILTDHDAEDRATFERKMGLGTVPANKNVSEGINAIASRLRVLGNGKPGLVIMRDACVERDPKLVEARKPTCTAEEIPGYIWAPGKEAPVKAEDDGCDAARYLVAELDLGSKTRVRYA